MKKSTIILLFSLAVNGSFAQETNNKTKTMDEEWGTTAVSDSLLSENATWYHDAKFAMFIHWCLYSEAGGEWEGKNYYCGTAFS